MTKIIQFGTGRFLRGFFAPVVPENNSIVVVQSRTQSSGAELINSCKDGYHVWTRGKQNGEIVDKAEIVHSIDRAVVASEHWTELLELVGKSDLQLIVSNTTEQGLQLDPADASFRENQIPHSFPARLLTLLRNRFQQGLPGISMLPMELVEFNGDRLRSLVLSQAESWSGFCSDNFKQWLRNENRWLNNLVDRIVVGVTDDPPWDNPDPVAVVGEPYRKLFVENDGGPDDVLPTHPMIKWVQDLKPLFLRKVRILNGLHTAMVGHCLPKGIETVFQAVSDPTERKWIDEVLYEEILPALDSIGLQEKEFANQVIERFENPFFKHRLSDIANGHETKLKTRIEPTIQDFQNSFGKSPEKLTSLIN